MEWWLLIPAVFIGFTSGLYPPFGVATLIALVFFVPAMLLLDPLGHGALFYIAYAMAIGLPCLVALWFRFTDDDGEAECEAARWQRKHDDGMLP